MKCEECGTEMGPYGCCKTIWGLQKELARERGLRSKLYISAKRLVNYMFEYHTGFDNVEEVYLTTLAAQLRD